MPLPNWKTGSRVQWWRHSVRNVCCVVRNERRNAQEKFRFIEERG
jgi:hypothetical protein